MNQQRQSFWLSISESVATRFGCQFLNWNRQSFWLPIFESAAAQLAADF
jgi:hypothetical protein